MAQKPLPLCSMDGQPEAVSLFADRFSASDWLEAAGALRRWVLVLRRIADGGAEAGGEVWPRAYCEQVLEVVRRMEERAKLAAMREEISLEQ